MHTSAAIIEQRLVDRKQDHSELIMVYIFKLIIQGGQKYNEMFWCYTHLPSFHVPQNYIYYFLLIITEHHQMPMVYSQGGA